MMRDGGHLALYDNHDALRREICAPLASATRKPTIAIRAT